MDYIIEIALNRFTDFNKFEEFATRIMTDDGYESIHAIGGISDMGLDGEEIRYYEDSTTRTVFQYSLDKKSKQKIIDTIEKLRSNKVKFENLVFVTATQINNTEELRTDIRRAFKNRFGLEIIERKTIIARLAANNYHLFNVYFPNFRAQIESMTFNKKVYFAGEDADAFQISLLKCSLLFTFNDKAHSTRKDLFDRLVLSTIASGKEASVAEVTMALEKKYSKHFDESQVKSALQRLDKLGLINETNGIYKASKKSIEYIEGSVSKIEESTDALIGDIIDKAAKISGLNFDRATVARLRGNTYKSLSAFFRLHGIDYARSTKGSESGPDYGFEKNKALIEITKDSLPQKLASTLIYAIGDTIKNPTDEQAEILTRWAKAFIGLQIMNLDPALKEFQATNFSKKTFIIDTDFLLYLIVEDCSLSSVYKRLVRQLRSLQCKLIIPKEVLAEVIKHGDAENNYTYFRSTFQNVDTNIVEEKIHNVFVKGYYSGLLSGHVSQSTSFKSYLSNYINRDAPYSFLVDLIEHYFPNTFTIEDFSSAPIAVQKRDLLDKLATAINNLTKNTFKAQWRTEEENYEVSLNDAKMYLTTYFLNEEASRDSNAILPGKYYLLTSSTRAARCGLKLGLSTAISVKPETLISLLDQMGSFEISSKEFVNIFENPYLVEVANECWDDVKVLIDAGVDLKDKNPINLTYELKDAIHSFLVDRKRQSEKDPEKTEKEDEEVELNDFINFAKHIKSKGYKLTPSVENIISKFREMQTDIKTKEDAILELKEKTALFGKKKQRYLDRIAAGKRKEK